MSTDGPPARSRAASFAGRARRLVTDPVGTARRWRARTARLRRFAAGTLTWAIKISAPDDASAARWGDMAFAADLAEALSTAGQNVRIDRLGAPAQAPADVTLVLRGLHRIAPEPASINLLWVISHPNDVADEEIALPWDRVFVASDFYARSASWGAEPLLQASSPRRFQPGPPDPDLHEEVVFVGTTRGVERPVIRDAIAAGAKVAIYGHNWEEFVDSSYIRADHLEFARVPAAYRSAGIVLNDHWEDMRAHGFVSNRLFDAAFVGARIISDRVPGADEVFGGLVQSYTTTEELEALLRGKGWPSESERLALTRRVRERHSFDARARTLIAAARAAAITARRR